jgi:hypothetical protein
MLQPQFLDAAQRRTAPVGPYNQRRNEVMSCATRTSAPQMGLPIAHWQLDRRLVGEWPRERGDLELRPMRKTDLSLGS